MKLCATLLKTSVRFMEVIYIRANKYIKILISVIRLKIDSCRSCSVKYTSSQNEIFFEVNSNNLIQGGEEQIPTGRLFFLYNCFLEDAIKLKLSHNYFFSLKMLFSYFVLSLIMFITNNVAH